MLGAERDLIANEVAAGQARLVFWPMLDLGPNSLNAAATAFCAGEQDPAAFWAAHDTLFENQRDVYGADRQYFVDVAAGLGLEATAFAACYDGAAVRDQIAALDAARREAGIFNRPTFDLNGQRLIGAQPYQAFAAAIDALLP